LSAEKWVKKHAGQYKGFSKSGSFRFEELLLIEWPSRERSSKLHSNMADIEGQIWT
jgi:hypothetical protein